MLTAKHLYYYQLRSASRLRVAQSYARQLRNASPSSWHGMTLASIDKRATDYTRLHWPKYYGPDTHLGFQDSWEILHRKFFPIPSFFDLAIWQRTADGDVLQGMALGKPSDGKTHLTVHWVERSFEPTYLRGGILLPVLACAEEYARLLGCRRVLIKAPVDPAKYARYGYTPYQLRRVYAAYLCKDL